MVARCLPIRAALTGLLLFCLFVAPGAHADPYRMGIGDTVDVEMLIVENGAFDDQSTMRLRSSAARIGPDGRTTISVIGGISAAGLTVEEFVEAVEAGVSGYFPVSSRVFITASIASYRQISVLGDVTEPGTYEFSPGMTLLEALAQAGGTGAVQLADIPPSRIVEAIGSRARAQDALERARAARERLQAAIAGAETFALENEIALGVEDVAREETLFQLDRQERAEVSEYLEGEIIRSEGDAMFLRERLDVLDRQVAEAQTEASRLSTLQERGMVRTDSVFQISNHMNALEIQRIAASENLQSAEQDIARSRLELARSETTRTIGLVQELQEIEAEISALNIQISQDSMLIGSPTSPDGIEAAYSFTIISQRYGNRRAGVSADASLAPGDIVQVTASDRPQLGD